MKRRESKHTYQFAIAKGNDWILNKLLGNEETRLKVKQLAGKAIKKRIFKL